MYVLPLQVVVLTAVVLEREYRGRAAAEKSDGSSARAAMSGSVSIVRTVRLELDLRTGRCSLQGFLMAGCGSMLSLSRQCGDEGIGMQWRTGIGWRWR